MKTRIAIIVYRQFAVVVALISLNNVNYYYHVMMSFVIGKLRMYSLLVVAYCCLS